jgi:hypothetical protein
MRCSDRKLCNGSRVHPTNRQNTSIYWSLEAKEYSSGLRQASISDTIASTRARYWANLDTSPPQERYRHHGLRLVVVLAAITDIAGAADHPVSRSLRRHAIQIPFWRMRGRKSGGL